MCDAIGLNETIPMKVIQLYALTECFVTYKVGFTLLFSVTLDVNNCNGHCLILTFFSYSLGHNSSDSKSSFIYLPQDFLCLPHNYISSYFRIHAA